MSRWVKIVVGLVLVAVVGLGALLAVRAGSEQEPAAPAPQPEGVLLIPGYLGDFGPLSQIRTALSGQGYRVEVLDIGSGLGNLEEYAAMAVEQAQSMLSYGAPRVSSVGFSAGGLIGRIAELDSPETFDKVISMATPHQGTLWALLSPDCPTACQQMRPDSDLLASLPDATDADDWLAVYSTTDEVVVPATSSALPGATVLTIQSVEPDAVVRHGKVPAHPVVIDAVSGFLRGEPVG